MDTPKQRRRVITANMDIISDLPDSLLRHILSFLPTRTAVATSVLSRRWRHIWEHLQAFRFSDESSNPSQFVAFVNNVLARRRVRQIQKFRLKHCVTGSNATANWIRSAVGPQLQELHLSLSSWLNMTIVLPRSIFSCSSLVSLTLEHGSFIFQLSSVHLPSLKNLHWEIRYWYRKAPIDELLSGCPVLETLELAFYDQNYAISVHLPPSVKRLTLSGFSIEHLQIETTSCLEYLYVGLFSSWHLSGSDLRSVCKLLRGLCRTKLLVLAPSTIEVVEQALLHVPVLEFPFFCGLIHLRLSGGAPYLCPRFLVDLLHKCPVLRVLKIEMIGFAKTNEYGDSTQPSIVPKCLVSELTTFEFRGYQDSADQNALVACILQSGLVLKTVRIVGTESTGYLEKKHLVLKRLSDLPRGSNMCQLKFD